MGNAFGLSVVKDAAVPVYWTLKTPFPKVLSTTKLTPLQFNEIIRGFESVNYFINAPKDQITQKLQIDTKFHKGYLVLSGPIDDDDDTRRDDTTAPTTTTRDDDDDDDDDDAREVSFDDCVGFLWSVTLLTVDKKRGKFYWIRSWIAVTDDSVFVAPQHFRVADIPAEQAAAAAAADAAAA